MRIYSVEITYKIPGKGLTWRTQKEITEVEAESATRALRQILEGRSENDIVSCVRIKNWPARGLPEVEEG